MTVHVLIIEHRHGTSVSVHTTPEGAQRVLNEYVAEWWEKETERPIPEIDGAAMVEEYFEATAGRESWIIETTEVIE